MNSMPVLSHAGWHRYVCGRYDIEWSKTDGEAGFWIVCEQQDTGALSWCTTRRTLREVRAWIQGESR